MSEPAPWRRGQQAGESFDVTDSSNGPPAPPPPPPPPCGAPPPPPPPGLAGGIPSMRISSEIEGRGRSPKPSAPGEPPAAIQNAMMTKDKKPFTYTPGGLDLSQIRSPRIQRRINRNMADEGVGPLPAHQEHGPLPPAAQAAMQPNLPVQVLPPPPPPPPTAGLGGGPPPSRFPAAPQPPPPSFAPPLGGAQASVSAQAVQQTAANLRPTGIAPLRRDPPAEPGSLYIAPVPAQASPAVARAQLGSLYIPPVAVDVADSALSSPPPPPQRQHFSPASPQAALHKAPTPWMSSYQPPQQQPQQQQPPQYMQQVRQPPSSPAAAAASPSGARIIPIQIEGREPSLPASPHSGGHTPQTPQEAHLSQWQREQQLRQQQRQQQSPQLQQQAPWRTVQAPSTPTQPGERVIPIQFESSAPSCSNGTSSPPVRQPFQQQQQQQQQQYQPPQQQQYQPHQFQQQPQRRPMAPMAPMGAPQQYNSGPEWGAAPPVQSQSFRVLQKITDERDGSVPRDQQPGRMNELNAAQLRKLQLNDEDRALMNRMKAQVDDEVYLHQEADPRYRGAAIPSRAFRMLQNMTGEDDGSTPMPSRISPAVRAAQQAVQESASQPYVPPSEQTVAEPRKYTGSAIPSRSFRMLQAMTAGSENCAANPSANESPTQSEPNSADAYGAEYDPSLPPYPPYPYPPPDSGQWPAEAPADGQPPTEEQQQQFWEHYNAMCAYMSRMNAALGYPPYGYAYDPYWGAAPAAAYHSDSEDCSGYSSTDEMTYYGARFAAHQLHPPDPSWYGYAPPWGAPPATPGTPSITVTTPTNEDAVEAAPQPDAAALAPPLQHTRTVLTDVEERSDEDDDDDSSDTEVEDAVDDASPLRSARSVTNVQVYSDSGDAGNEDSDEEEEDDEDVEDVVIPAAEQYPHQLSVIPEESDASDAESVRRRQRELSTSTTTALSEDDDDATDDDDLGDDDDDAESTTVTVRLPLKLHFTRSENDEEVTTVIVGEVRRSSTSSNDSSASSPRSEKQRPVFPTLPAQRRASDTTTATATALSSPGTPSSAASTASSDVSVVFPFRARRSSAGSAAPSSPVCTSSTEDEERGRSNEESDCHWEDDSSSTSIQTVRRHGQLGGQHSGSEVSDGPWEDDSSSTSVQTVKTRDEEPPRDAQDVDEVEEEDDFEWGEDGTLQTVVRRRSSAFEEKEDEDDVEPLPEDPHIAAAAAAEDSDNDDLSCSSSSSESSSSSSSTSSSSSSSCSGSSRASSAVVCSKSSCVASGSSLRSSARGSVDAIEAAAVAVVGADGPGDEEEDDDDEEENEDDDEEELESDSKPEDVEKCVRGLIAHLSASPSGHLLLLPRPPRDDDAHDAHDVPSTPDEKAERSEEEDDSGVTSDMSRHISEAENEEGGETTTTARSRPRKISKYQRAQTHSRLFRLLQDESLNTAVVEEAAQQQQQPELGALANRKECLTLPLGAALSDVDSVSLSSSSGITSPSSPTVTDRLVRDLVQTLLQRKKGRRLRKVPMAKLQAAALRILQEDMDPYDTSTSEEGGSGLLRSPCQRVPPTHGAYGQEYTSYYETWGQGDLGADDLADYDIMPSRAFRLFDQHARPSGFSPGVIEGLRAKCPRVRSGKDLHKGLQQLQLHDDDDGGLPGGADLPADPPSPSPATTPPCDGLGLGAAACRTDGN